MKITRDMVEGLIETTILMTVIWLFVGCSVNSSNEENQIFSNFESCVIIDGCEYGCYRTYGFSMEYTHKGNCKTCIARNKKTIDEAVEQITKKSSIQLEKEDVQKGNIAVSSPQYNVSNIISNNESFSNFGKVINVNGCQYAICFGQDFSYTHIGTCTNCEARIKQMIERIVRINLFKNYEKGYNMGSKNE